MIFVSKSNTLSSTVKTFPAFNSTDFCLSYFLPPHLGLSFHPKINTLKNKILVRLFRNYEFLSFLGYYQLLLILLLLNNFRYRAGRLSFLFVRSTLFSVVEVYVTMSSRLSDGFWNSGFIHASEQRDHLTKMPLRREPV